MNLESGNSKFNHKEDEAPAAQSHAKDKSGYALPPEILTPANREPSPATNAKPKKKQNRCTSKLNVAIKFLELVALVVGIALFYITYLQYRESQITRKVSERAWVTAGKILALIEVDTNNAAIGVTFRMPVKNSGSTPAINVAPQAGYYDSVDKIPIRDVFPKPLYTSVLLAPDDTIDIPPIYTGINNFEYIQAGKPFYMAGTIFYEDVFGDKHWSQFCWKIEKDFSVVPMPFHFSCDDSEAHNKK